MFAFAAKRLFPLVLALVWLAGACAGVRPPPVDTPESVDGGVQDGAVGDGEIRPEDDNIDVAGLGPYFDDIFDGEAALALKEDRLEDAMRGFDEIARRVEDPVLTPRARFMGAYLAGRLGDNARALAELPGLAHQLPLLAHTAWETAARSALVLKKYDEAERLASFVPRLSPLYASAMLIRADSRRLSEKPLEAAGLYREFLSTWPAAFNKYEARTLLVECLTDAAARGGDDAEGYALEVLEQISFLQSQAAGNKWTRRAQKQEKKALGALGRKPVEARKEKKKALDAFQKASSLKGRMKNAEADKVFARAIRLSRKHGSLWCRAMMGQAAVAGRRKDHSRAAELYQGAADNCDDVGVQVKALFRAGKTFMGADRFAEAIESFRLLEEKFSDHSYADDARLHMARVYLAQGNQDKFLELVSSIPEAYPDGDMRAEALWIAASHWLRQDDWEAAREVLKSYYEAFPVEEGWYSAGRSGYWLARAEDVLGNTDDAMIHYEHVLATAPFSHYMVLAYSRMAEIDEDRASALLARLCPPGGELSARFPPGLLEEFPALGYGTELIRIGLTTRARRVLSEVIDDPGTPATVHWIIGALFRRVGEFGVATEVSRGMSAGMTRRYPSGPDLAGWITAYPTAFEVEVRNAAEESGVDPAMLWAVMREESGFNARVESWANAIGLMQLIMPTAKSMGKRLGISVNRKSLKNPKTNVRLGAAYLAYLGVRFDNHPALMIAGYNAGEGAVAKWIRDRPEVPVDLFVDQIPYKQTRGYTKRVLSSLAAYHFLYGENRPMLLVPAELP